MNLPEPISADVIPGASELLNRAGLGGSQPTLTPLTGGANNQVYRIDFPNHATAVLKRYFSSPDDERDRFHSEKSFYDWIDACGLRGCSPQALGWSREHRLGLFSWIEGRRLEPEEIDEAAVDQALAFYFSLNAHPDSERAAQIPNASEACFDLKEHFACVERRILRLKGIRVESDVDREASLFVSENLEPTFTQYGESRRGAESWETASLQIQQRCLSPSDFGFHNALKKEDGSLVFLDFEYAGWDDPAKFLCDFLCQPAVPVPRRLWQRCIDSICRPVSGGSVRERLDVLLPLYQLKWCCIMLNEFLPREQSRRAFSKKLSASDLEEKKYNQLRKARNLLERLIA